MGQQYTVKPLQRITVKNLETEAAVSTAEKVMDKEAENSAAALATQHYSL